MTLITPKSDLSTPNSTQHDHASLPVNEARLKVQYISVRLVFFAHMFNHVLAVDGRASLRLDLARAM